MRVPTNDVEDMLLGVPDLKYRRLEISDWIKLDDKQYKTIIFYMDGLYWRGTVSKYLSKTPNDYKGHSLKNNIVIKYSYEDNDYVEFELVHQEGIKENGIRKIIYRTAK